jgi:hypothetical protein
MEKYTEEEIKKYIDKMSLNDLEENSKFLKDQKDKFMDVYNYNTSILQDRINEYKYKEYFQDLKEVENTYYFSMKEDDIKKVRITLLSLGKVFKDKMFPVIEKRAWSFIVWEGVIIESNWLPGKTTITPSIVKERNKITKEKFNELFEMLKFDDKGKELFNSMFEENFPDIKPLKIGE